MATTVLGLKTFAASDPVDYNEINDNYNKIDTGVKTAFQGRAAHNWLDNSWLVNPVNQRGATSWASSGYTIDRWRTNSAISVNLSSTGITMDATSTGGELQQNVRGLPNGTYTFAALVNGVVRTRVFTNNNGTITNVDTSNASFDGSGYLALGKGSGDYYFQIKTAVGYTNTVAWAALYEGSYTASTLPAYQPKGYAAELAECQMYKRDMLVGNGYITAIAFDNKQARLYIPYAMRTTPTVVFDARMKLKDLASGTVFNITDMSAANQTMNGFTLSITTDGLTTGKSYVLISGSSSYKIEYSCEL